MKKLIVLAVASLFATNAMAGEMKWSGSAGWRYETKTTNDELSATNNVGTTTTNAGHGKDVSKYNTRAYKLRANLGVNGGWENVEYGAGLRTGTTSVNSDWQTVGGNQDIGIALEQAWFRYMHDFGSVDTSLTLGRQKNVMSYDMKSENFFDNDVRWDGFGWQFKFGMFGLNAAQYITGGKTAGASTNSSTYSYTEATQEVPTSKAKMNMLIAFQPYMNWKFSDEIETMFAVGYYAWSDESNTNQTGGGTNSLGNRTAAASTAVSIDGAAFKVHNLRQWQFFNTWTLPYNLAFSAEYVMAQKAYMSPETITGYGGGIVQPDVSRSAWAAGLTYGAVKKAHDWSVSYYYGNKGLASVMNAYTNSSFMADNKGHTFKAMYAIADNFNLGWKGIWIEEKNRMNPNTGAAFTGVNANQFMKTKYMEFTAGVNF